MYKIWIIFEREYLQRVKKKSFLMTQPHDWVIRDPSYKTYHPNTIS